MICGAYCSIDSRRYYMSQWITEEQTPHLRLSAEAEEVLIFW